MVIKNRGQIGILYPSRTFMVIDQLIFDIQSKLMYQMKANDLLNNSVSEKGFDLPDIMSEAHRSSIGHCSVSIGHLEHMILILHNYCRTICPTFCSKTSDIGVETSDMSGCPTVFQKHWNNIIK